MRRGGRRAALAGAALLCSACLHASVPDAELPDAPIAVSFLPQEEARQRAEARREQAGRRGLPGGATAVERDPLDPIDPFEQRAIATPQSVGAYLDRVLGGTESEDPDLRGRLALLDPRDRTLTLIDAARRGSLPQDWSPDRARLLFSQPGERDYQLYEYDLAERTVSPVTQGPDAHTQGCYAADGRIVVVVVDTRRIPYRSHIAVSGPGGRRPYRPVSEGPSDHTPACAPDGRGVAFVRESSPGTTAIWIASLDAEAPPRRLSPGRHPVFSPDGAWIAFAAPWRRELRLWRMRSDGSGRAAAGRGVRHEARPAFSPDGRLLVYVAGEDPARRQLYLRRFDGSGDRILFADGDAEYPVW